MNAPVTKGWCPTLLTPMESGDGYLVRVKPVAAQLTATAAVAVADAAGGGHEDQKSGAEAGDDEDGKEGGGHSTVKRMVNGELGVYRDLSSNKLHHPRISKRQESDALLENRPVSPESKGGGGAGGDVAQGKKKFV